MSDAIAHLTRQAAYSRATFGPGPRTAGVSDHVRKELVEIAEVYEKNDGNPDQQPDTAVHTQAALEWTDVAILGLDGLLRAISAAHPKWPFDQVAATAWQFILDKQGRNELRTWPDWRTADPSKAIEHDRSGEKTGFISASDPRAAGQKCFSTGGND